MFYRNVAVVQVRAVPIFLGFGSSADPSGCKPRVRERRETREPGNSGRVAVITGAGSGLVGPLSRTRSHRRPSKRIANRGPSTVLINGLAGCAMEVGRKARRVARREV